MEPSEHSNLSIKEELSLSKESKQTLSTALGLIKKKKRETIKAEKKVQQMGHAPKGWIIVNNRKHRTKQKAAASILNAIIQEAGRGPGEAGTGS